MAPSATIKARSDVSNVSGRPGFRYGGIPMPAGQNTSLNQVRIPRYESLEDEREFRKLHHAAALRWLSSKGYNNEGAGGHMTVRDPVLTDHFWINPHGKSFAYIKPDDLCLVNSDGVVVGGNMHAINPAGFIIHSHVHAARPDVIAAVHCHSVPSKAFASLGKKLDMINQDACRFYKCHGLYKDFGGSALEPQEGINIAEALGQNKAVILRGHGLLTVSKTPDGAAFLFGALDRVCEAQLMADAAGEALQVDTSAADFTQKVYNDELEYITFQPAFEDIVRQSEGELPLSPPNVGFDQVPI